LTIAEIQTAGNNFEKGNMKKFLVEYHKENTESMFYGWSNLWLHKDFLNWNIENSLKNINCPVFVIQGGNDNYGSIAHVNKILKGVNGPAESLIINECGHIPHVQAKDFVLENMNKFILKILRNNFNKTSDSTNENG
jgi:pimeloyl-ACP methyl ester carboxylesterase